MEAELAAARDRIAQLEQQVIACMTEAERVKVEARRLYQTQHQLHQEMFHMQRRLDNYALSNTQLARQVYPPASHTAYPAHEVLTVDFA